MEDLATDLRDQIDLLFIESKRLLETGDKIGAIKIAESAWRKLPDPKFGWDVSKSFTRALAETYRDAGVYEEALNVMNLLFASETVKPHQDGPRFIMGSIYFAMGDLANARKWFKEADEISKGRCFQGEDKKYLDFYKQRASGG